MRSLSLFNHACIPDVSFSERRENIDVAEFHVGWQKSYSRFMKHAEKESKPLEKRDNGKVCAVTARHPWHTQLHTTPVLLVPTLHVWGNRRAVATHTAALATMGLLAHSAH